MNARVQARILRDVAVDAKSVVNGQPRLNPMIVLESIVTRCHAVADRIDAVASLSLESRIERVCRKMDPAFDMLTVKEREVERAWVSRVLIAHEAEDES